MVRYMKTKLSRYINIMMKIQAKMSTGWKITQLGNSEVKCLPVEWIRYKTNISDLKIQ